MQFRRLGKSGLEVSALGLGTNAFGSRTSADDSIRIIQFAIDHGINFIDTANIYSHSESERIIGKALTARRQEVVLATKAGLPTGAGPIDKGSSRGHLLRELEASLKRLKTDYIDLYQIHTFDPLTPLEETLRTLDDLVRAGTIRYIGASNYTAWELMKALGISDHLHLNRYVSIQPSYSLADRTIERDLVPLCLDQGVGVIPYFPLAGGLLTGKYRTADAVPEGSRADKNPDFKKRLDNRRIELANQVAKLADELAVAPATLSLAWLLRQPGVATVIAGATSVSQLQANLDCVRLDLDEQTLAKLAEWSQEFKHGQPFASYRIDE